MSEIIHASQVRMMVPVPKAELNIRPGTMADVEFIDALQKKHNKQIGFMHTATLHGKIALGDVLIAEEQVDSRSSIVDGAETCNYRPSTIDHRLGYLIGSDRYFKRDDLGIIYHLNVSPGRQRGYVGAALLRAQFDRSAYGCRLYCCWCAQDIAANHFWESMGFVPLAYRNGSESKKRVHIFWQKKIRGADDTVNWWFPSKTDQGAMKADRLAFPIPPGVHWSEVKPIVIPGQEQEQKKLPRQHAPKPQVVPVPMPATRRRPQFGRPTMSPLPAPPPTPAVVAPVKVEKPKREKKKIDPQFVSAARELRDRYLEQVNEHGYRLESVGKYDLKKSIVNSRESIENASLPLSTIDYRPSTDPKLLDAA